MKTSIWYHTREKNPDQHGYYLSYKTYNLGDDSENLGYYYYDSRKNQWREYESVTSHDVRILYWTASHPADWANDAIGDLPQSNQALDIAWKKVEEAVKQYEIVRALIRDQDKSN